MDFSKVKKVAPFAVGGTLVAGVAALGVRKAMASESKATPSPPKTPAQALPASIPIVKPQAPNPPLPVVIPSGPGSVPLSNTREGTKMVVTTNDPAPAGDLVIRVQPNVSAPMIPGGGADKEGIVTVIRQVDDQWSEVYWPGGRRPGGQGFAKHAYLRPVSNVAIPPAEVIGAKAIVTTNDPAPSGDLIVRAQPNTTAPQIGGIDKNGIVTIIRDVDTTWAEILWPGGRNPKVQGFAKKAYLKLI